MSIANEIKRMGNAKSAIASAIASKGVTVPSDTKLDGMAPLIGQIEQGGGAEMVSGTISGNAPTTLYVNESGGVSYLWGEGTITCPKNSLLIFEESTMSTFMTDNCYMETAYTTDSDSLADIVAVVLVTGDNFSVTF